MVGNAYEQKMGRQKWAGLSAVIAARIGSTANTPILAAH
jgi:hypothetical protein